MAQVKSFKFGETMILIGDGATPEVFAAPCGLNEMTMTMTADTAETILPDCANPDDPAWKVTDVSALQMTLSGTGVLDKDARVTWEDWMMSGAEVNVRWMYDVLLADGGGYYQAPAILTNITVTATRGQRATVDVSITLNGKPTFTDASA